MSFNAKTTAFAAAGFLAIAGGVYAFMPANQESASGTHKIAGSAPAVKTADTTNPVSTTGQPASEEAAAQSSDTTAAPQPSSKDQTASQAPKKLTRAQLTPPPATENEKLEKAAEQESNF